MSDAESGGRGQRTAEREADELLFERYLSTTYRARNDVSQDGLERAVASCELEFGQYLPSEGDAPILEIGCGVGSFLELCRRRGHGRVRGVDISPEQIEFCRRRGLPNVECNDALSCLRDDERSYALILMSDVLEHLPREEVLPVLQAAAERLASGGRLVIRVPNLSNPLNLRTRYVDFTHQVGLTQESLGQVLRIAGLAVESIHGSFHEHRRWLARALFDRLLWRLFRLLYRHVFHLKDRPVRGKNLIAVARREE